MTTIPVYSFIAFSGTGKTTLLEKLIPELKARGLRVAVLKHDAHDFEIDHEGKDSWRMTQAGADVTVITSDKKAAIMENRPISAETLMEKITDVDIILTEGYKHGDWKKIGIYRQSSGNPLAARPEDCFAVMSDVPLDITAICLDLDDISGLARLIIDDMKKAGGNKMIKPGLEGYAETTVTEANTAVAAGSGTLEVFATPYMTALMEKAACLSLAPYLEKGHNSVGTGLNIKHTSATPIGMKVWAKSVVIAAEGRKITFEVTAFDETGPIGSGTHERYIIESEKFMEKCRSKGGEV